jgi:aspartate/methionine/tyrosine aminotransferase
LREENGFAFDPEELGSLLTDKTRLVILNSPANPTGGIVGRRALDRAAELILARKDVWVLADEIYYDFVYEGEFESISTVPGILDRLIILDGFSKSYAMTGWRAGYGLMPAALAEKITTLQINSNSCTSSFTQRACLAALTGPREPVKSMVAEFKARRDAFVAGLNTVPGVTCTMPGGAFYAFPNVKAFGKTSQEMETFLMNVAGVAGLAGTAFGQFGEGYLRFSYASSRAQLDLAIERMKEALGKL